MDIAYEYAKTTLDYDLDAVTRAREGDREAFEILYRRHVGRVHAVCFRIVANQSRAEELTQQVFIRAWETLGSFRGESAFASWLYRVTVNVVLVDIRSEKRRTSRITAHESLDRYEETHHRSSPETSMDIEEAIAELPSQARVIFVLHDIEGYQHDEIAEMMGLAIGTTKSQLHRARKLLKVRLQQ
ncbi:MAG TPA: sigma-70 family RNA polymerase sigma factor [Bacteroidota bacterium]|nr:sigma-70 family RNA polymerase sigma factor [Bacteroidota bacterium]